MDKPVYCHLSLARFEGDYPVYETAASAIEFMLHGDELDDWRRNGAWAALKRLRDGYNPPLTLHGPVFGFDPASRDRGVRELAWRRVQEAFEVALVADPEVLVFHSSYNRFLHRFEKDRFVEASAEFWSRALKQLPSGRMRIALENIFDETPEPLAGVLGVLPHPRLGFCFDVGHHHIFADSPDMLAFLGALGPRLLHVHLHDNVGAEDLHLPAGGGAIDYTPLLAFLDSHPEPWSLTVEGKTPDDNAAGVDFVRRRLRAYALSDSPSSSLKRR